MISSCQDWTWWLWDERTVFFSRSEPSRPKAVARFLSRFPGFWCFWSMQVSCFRRFGRTWTKWISMFYRLQRLSRTCSGWTFGWETPLKISGAIRRLEFWRPRTWFVLIHRRFIHQFFGFRTDFPDTSPNSKSESHSFKKTHHKTTDSTFLEFLDMFFFFNAGSQGAWVSILNHGHPWLGWFGGTSVYRKPP